MKYPALQSISEVLPELERFDAVLDVRSPSEFAEDHLPGAINCPVLDDKERERVGTMYKQIGAFEAKKIGAALVSANIGRHIDKLFLGKPRDWRPLVYCWRGGNRSGAMAHVLARIGWSAVQLDGGYREYRRHVNTALAELPDRFKFEVICGTTGSGKSRLLQTLHALGAQVLDLEALAAHRGSVLGNLPFEQQPSQKAFESSIWHALHRFDTERVIFVEAESKKIGNLRVPDRLMERMRASPCISLILTRDERVGLLTAEYIHFVDDPALLSRQLACLIPLHGKDTIARWQSMAAAGEMHALVEELLACHYDPAYLRSINRNFVHFSSARLLELPDISDAAFTAAAQTLMKNYPVLK